MNKTLKISQCADCRHRHTYKTVKRSLRPICEKAARDILNIAEIPDWCPLEDHKDVAALEKRVAELEEHREYQYQENSELAGYANRAEEMVRVFAAECDALEERRLRREQRIANAFCRQSIQRKKATEQRDCLADEVDELASEFEELKKWSVIFASSIHGLLEPNTEFELLVDGEKRVGGAIRACLVEINEFREMLK